MKKRNKKEEKFIKDLYKEMPKVISEKQQKWLRDIVKKKLEYSDKAVAVLVYATVKQEEKPIEGKVVVIKRTDAPLLVNTNPANVNLNS